MAALEAERELAAEAEARRRELGRLAAERQHHPERVTQIVAEPSPESREQAAQLLGTNPRYVSDAKRLTRERPDLAGLP